MLARVHIWKLLLAVFFFLAAYFERSWIIVLPGAYLLYDAFRRPTCIDNACEAPDTNKR